MRHETRIVLGAIFNFDWCTLASKILLESDAVKLTLVWFSDGSLPLQFLFIFGGHDWGIDHFKVLIKTYGHHLVVIFGLYVYWWTALLKFISLYSSISKNRRPKLIFFQSNYWFCLFFSPIDFIQLIWSNFCERIILLMSNIAFNWRATIVPHLHFFQTMDW